MLSRRTFVRGALAALPLSFLWRRRAHAAGPGPLIADPDRILDLPAGFSYRILDRRGAPMTDGYRVPGAPDGMACFAGPAGTNTLVLMRNHELSNGDPGWGPIAPGQAAPAHRYDPASQGGVTRVVLDATTLAPVSSNLVLFGTIRNCNGGVSPWGWLTCEEDTSTGHGYVFLCPITADGVQPPQRIDAYGRMNHEAAVVDPATFVAYLTEDRADSCFYRFVPTSRSTPWQGRLQALRVLGHDRFDTGAGRAVGDRWQVDWVDVEDRVPALDTCRTEARGRGAARFARGEGLWMHEGSLYFTATGGGPLGGGQVFRFDPDGDHGTLTLLAQCDDRSVLDGPDGITVSPWGDVYLCEDGGGEQHLRVLAPDGTMIDLARNAASNSELCGACFSPDGRVLFLSLHADGITLAITGPFPNAPPEHPDPDPGPQPAWTDHGLSPAAPGDDVDADLTGGCSAGGGAALGTTVAIAAAATARRR